MGKKAPAPPPAPDPRATAQAQSEFNMDAARANARLNRVNQYTPDGSLTYTELPGDRWEARTAYSPTQQRLADLSTGAQETYGRAALNQLGQVEQRLSTPFQFDGPRFTGDVRDRSGGLRYGVQDRTGGLQYGVQDRTGGLQYGVADRTGGLQYGVQDRSNALQYGVADRTGELRRDIGDYSQSLRYDTPDRTGQMQSGVNLAQRADFTGIGDPNQSRDAVQQALLSRINPELERERAALESRLANQGITMGSEAWNTGMQDYSRAANDARFGAILNAGNEQSRVFNLGLQQAGLGNEARLSEGSFRNSAVGQAAQMDLARANLANTATQSAYGMGLGRAGFANAATAQAADNDMNRARLTNEANQQAYAMDIGRSEFTNAANQQALGQDLARAEFTNAANQQALGQDLARSEFTNAASQQALGQDLARSEFTNAASQQALGQDLDRAQFANAASQQAYGMDRDRAQFRNAAIQQAYGMDLGRAQFGNAARQQSLEEQLALRGQPINEASALLSGSQVNLPQFQNVAQTQYSAPDYAGSVAQNYAGATSMWNAANQSAGAKNAAVAGAFGSLAGAGLGGWARNGFKFGG